eukprot:TRINITY_DN2054_c0_g1_i1.p1 TRINITY_DN2054_c0_g1~~TRINITY_DN2054_c0_g1_i1.p1  ORF type:complete len:354 (+),score=52.35 TRINITY_DN2054_c0_g1_i1:785-1846(+)
MQEDIAHLKPEDQSAKLLTAFNCFAAQNRAVLGETATDLLLYPASVVGLTSTGKDTMASLLVNAPGLAVTARDMCTAANVNLFVLPGKEERFAVHFREENFETTSAPEYLQHMEQLMQRIREKERNKITAEPVLVNYSSPSVTSGSYILNTVGLISRARGDDPITAMINRQLNDNEKLGGILVVCHSSERPLDESAAWLELDVVKKWVHDRSNCKTEVILALTKADQLCNQANFANCHTVKELHECIFLSGCAAQHGDVLGHGVDQRRAQHHSRAPEAASRRCRQCTRAHSENPRRGKRVAVPQAAQGSCRHRQASASFLLACAPPEPRISRRLQQVPLHWRPHSVRRAMQIV